MADLISAIAALLWPLLVIVMLLVFGRQLLSKLKNSDDVTLEIGGQRLNFKQATDQQSDMITDLQREVASLRTRLAAVEFTGGASYRQRPADRLPVDHSERATDKFWTDPYDTPGEVVEEEIEAEQLPEALPWGGAVPAVPGKSGGPAQHSILWVDDHPENNAVLADSWRRDGAHVEIARSTGEALRLLENRAYGLIISDMGRQESGVDVPDAGLRLLAEVRATRPGTPFVLYGNVGPLSDAAKAAGATMVTGSTFELMEFASGLGMIDGA